MFDSFQVVTPGEFVRNWRSSHEQHLAWCAMEGVIPISRIDEYRTQLRGMSDWVPYLLAESGLPGPRGNLELAAAVALEGETAFFLSLLEYTPERAPTGTAEEFLAFCGVAGLGASIARGERSLMQLLRPYAFDPRWRIREAVAMALQSVGRRNFAMLLMEMKEWSRGSLLEQRAAAAALAEPALLQDPGNAEAALGILDEITGSLAAAQDRKCEDFKILRQGLGYCWSVVVAAAPTRGKALMDKWIACSDPDVRWMMRENLKKKRLERLDPAWVAQARGRLG